MTLATVRQDWLSAKAVVSASSMGQQAREAAALWSSGADGASGLMRNPGWKIQMRTAAQWLAALQGVASPGQPEKPRSIAAGDSRQFAASQPACL